jgi:hypothetical protein
MIDRGETEDELDPHEDCSANMLRDLHRIKATVADPEMQSALLADMKEYDYLLTRIQLELSVIVPPRFKVICNG